MKGVRYNQGKLLFNLIEPEFEKQLAEVMTFGAKKYDINNWKKIPKHKGIDDCKNSLMRHFNAYRRGEFIDEDSGKPHLACLAVNSMFLYWYETEGEESGART